eukprot:TRINITY_DN616_c1_g2_i1.p1 TRINITY_DN616_c1_g2~~TRINITY_DN616_c1_g2_i1.p1  ORF type:complete len:789 (-),score=198.80 TRINITY_DN616_c1_g2_i1:93-2459(-)
MAQFICIPSKETVQLDMIKPLTKFIKEQFGEAIYEEHKESIEKVNQLREDIRCMGDQKTEKILQLLRRYHGVLSSLEGRFPVNEENLKLKFVWLDVFRQRKHSRFTVSFEKACLLYNTAAVEMYLGAVQCRDDDAGIKIACNHFQTASGTLVALQKHMAGHPQDSVSPDLANEVVEVFITLCMAQAQECYVEKAIRGKMKPAIVTRLAEQCGDYYDGVYQQATTTGHDFDRDWLDHNRIRGGVFHGMAHQLSAQVAYAKDEYGLQVAHLRYAVTQANEAKKYEKNAQPSVKEMITSIHSSVHSEAAKAEEENTVVYHDRVPKILPAVPKKPMCKTLTFKTTALPVAEDPFAKLVPYTIHQASSVYNEKKAALMRTQSDAIDDQNEVAKGMLNSMNLPGALQALEQPEGVPQHLQDKVKAVNAKGGVTRVLELQDTLAKLAMEDAAILQSALANLDREEEEDSQLRLQFGAKWTRTPSHTLTHNIRQEASKYNSNIEHAQKSDSFVRKKFVDHQQFITKLSGSIHDAVSMLPSATPCKVDGVVIDQMKNNLRAFDQTIAARNALKQELRDAVDKDDITTRLFGVASEDQDKFFVTEMEKFQPIVQRIRDNFAEQERVLAVISSVNAKLVGTKTVDVGARQRENILQRFETAYKTFNELQENLTEGIDFYVNFQDLVAKFKEKCTDFVMARSAEKNDHLGQIQAQATGYSVSSAQGNIIDHDIPRTAGSNTSTPASWSTSTPMYSSTPPAAQAFTPSAPMTSAPSMFSASAAAPATPVFPFAQPDRKSVV